MTAEKCSHCDCILLNQDMNWIKHLFFYLVGMDGFKYYFIRLY